MSQQMVPSTARLGAEPVEVVVRPGVLASNARALKRYIGPEVALMVMVKGNGYGHGTITAARALIAGGATWLGVASPEVAYELRDLGARVLNVGWTPPAEYQPMIQLGIDISVFDAHSIDTVAEVAHSIRRQARVQVKVDTGMHRLGVPLADVGHVVDMLGRRHDDLLVTGLFTHFANADSENFEPTLAQHDRFLEVLRQLQTVAPGAMVHCANGSAILRQPALAHDMVRVGIAAYGYPHRLAAGVVELSGAMRVASWVVRVEEVGAGVAIGYGGLWSASGPRRIATVWCGYADGVPRQSAGRGVVLIRGQRCPIVGAVSMNFTTVDVTGSDRVEVGDEVVLIGEQWGQKLGADEVADRVGTIPNDILCSIAPTVRRIVLE